MGQASYLWSYRPIYHVYMYTYINLDFYVEGMNQIFLYAVGLLHNMSNQAQVWPVY